MILKIFSEGKKIFVTIFEIKFFPFFFNIHKRHRIEKISIVKNLESKIFYRPSSRMRNFGEKFLKQMFILVSMAILDFSLMR